MLLEILTTAPPFLGRSYLSYLGRRDLKNES